MAKRRGKGEGSIFRRKQDGLWASTVNLAHRGGRRRRRTVYGRTRQEVIQKLKELHHAQLSGVNLAPDKITVEVFLAQWLEQTVKVSKTLGTHSNYSNMARLYINPAIGQVQLASLESVQVQAMLNEMREAGLSARTCELTRAVLRRALNHAIKRGMVHRNVATLVELPRKEKFKAMPLGHEEALVLLRALKGHRNEALYRLELSLGLRKGEALALLWENIDFERKTIRIEASIQEYDGVLHRVAPKTESSIATLPLPDVLAQALLQHRERQDRERTRKSWQEHGLVFPSTRGNPMRPSNVSLSFKRILKRAGLPEKTRFHDLRHSCATLLIAQGVHISVVKEVLRHSQLSVTSDLYGHVLPPTMRSAIDGLDTALGSLEEEEEEGE